MEEKQPIKFRKYHETDTFKEKCDDNIINPGDITFVSKEKQIYLGHARYVKKQRNKGGGCPIIVDKIWPKNICILPCPAPVGYRVGYCRYQDVKLAIATASMTEGNLHTNYFDASCYISSIDEIYHNLPSGVYWDNHFTKSFMDGYLNDIYRYYTRFNLKVYTLDSSLIYTNEYTKFERDYDDENPKAYKASIYCDSIPDIIPTKRRYISINYNSAYRIFSGYFEKENDGWYFHQSNLMIGNKGKLKIENGKIISTSLRPEFSNVTLNYDEFVDWLSEVQMEYNTKVYLKTQTRYNVYVKYKRKRKKRNDLRHYFSITNKKWTKLFGGFKFKHGPLKEHRSDESESALFTKIDIIREYQNMIPWSEHVQTKLPGVVIYKYNDETKQIDKFFKVKYLDFCVGKRGDSENGPTLDEHSISFRCYFGKTNIRIEIKTALTDHGIV